MKIFNELNENKWLSLAFGFFDGVHLGHQAVIESAVSYAKENDKKSAIITFKNHPCCFFNHIKPKYITKISDKFLLFEKLGVDYVYCLDFDEHLALMSASDYLKEIIINYFEPCAISTGFNHFFGAEKSGNVKFLAKMQESFAYKYIEVPPVLFNNEVISSTRIRENIAIGNIELVNSMLGFEYSIEETVIKGRQIGGTIGFKTANLVYPKDMLEPAFGVYCVNVDYESKMYKGIANFGLRPTVDNTIHPILEVHILDFDKEIYGEKIRVHFLKKIRDEKKFGSLDELKAQIQKDISALN